MPYQRWVNTCPCSTYLRTGDPKCPSCGQQREVAGWSYSMHESMAAYQSLYGLKPVGPHRKLADESFRSMTVSCDACGGEGLLDDPPRWIACGTCRGLCRVFTVPPEVVDGVRSQILEAFPDAAAERLEGFPGTPVIHDLATGEILGADESERTPDRAPLHPAYFTTRLRWEGAEAPDWPKEFVIISAHATTGERWSDEENDAADEALYDELIQRDLWIEFVTGYEPASGHAEPSYAVVLPLNKARELGRSFRQDAIFYVRGDELFVTRCEDGAPLVPVGPFRARLDLVVGESYRRDLDEDSPWVRLSAERFLESLDARLVDDAEATQSTGRVFRPRRPFTLGDVALEAAAPDDKPLLRPDVKADYWPLRDLADRLPWIGDIGTIIECSVTDSMVSSVWGLGEFAIGDRGYVYYINDYEGFDHGTPEVLGAWEPRKDPAAKRACVVSSYARSWDKIGLPPLLGQWVSGDPDLLIACLLRVLDGPTGSRASWDGIVDTILTTDWLHFRNRAGLDAVSEHFSIPFTRLSRAAWSLEASEFLPRVARGEVTPAEREAVAALYLGCITWGLEPDPKDSQWLGPVNELCGSWQIGYADVEGMIEEGPLEHLDLRPDGSFSWEPEPSWLAESGAWGIEVTPNGEPRLCFDTDTGDRRCHYVVLHEMPDVGTFFHLQRSRADAVVFKDRILRGYRLSRE